MEGICALEKSGEASLLLASAMWNCRKEESFTRHRICQDLDFELPNFQNCEQF